MAFQATLSREPDEWAPSVEEYAETIALALGDALKAVGIDPDPVTLLVEPGRSLFGDAGVHLTRVRNVKRQTAGGHFTWVESDTSQWFMMHGIAEASR